MSKTALTLALAAILSSHSAFAALDVEEQRLDAARQAIPTVVSRYQAMVDDLDSKYYFKNKFD